MRNFITLSLFSIIWSITLPESVFAQNTGAIRGRVTDISTNEPLAFVTLVITGDLPSTLSRSFQTGADGRFSLDKLALGSYSIKLTYIGYQTKSITQIVLNADRPEINLLDISLNTDSKMLEEVIVEYKKPVIEMLDDKLVYNVDQGVFSEGSVVSDILKNVPMVSVDIDGKATIAGRRNTRIFIDGKPSDFSANTIGELLSVLPSDALESIEVITDPSSKFDADGDGIINLVMKKGKKVGLSGNLSTNAGTLWNYNAGAFISSGKKEAFSFNASAGYNHGVNQSDVSSSRSNSLPDTVFYNNQSNSSDRISNGSNLRFSGSFKPDSLQLLKFSARGGFNNGQTASASDNRYFNEELLEKKLRTQNNNTGNNSLNYVLDADYSLKGKGKQGYKFGMNYNRNLNDDRRDYSRYLYNPDGTLMDNKPDLQLNENDNAGSNLELSADMDQSFDFLKLKVETGTKFNLNHSDNEQLVRRFDYLTESYEISPALSNSFDFRQNIYAGYFSFRLSVKDWSLRAGSRAEVTEISLSQEGKDNISLKPYLNLFPSLVLTRTFNSKYRVVLNYSRRVTRPRYNVLNPSIDDSDPQNIKFGNINLKPSFTDQYEISFTVFGKGWSVSPRVSYAASNKIIERIKTVINGNGDTETTYQNLAYSSSLNFNTFANYQVDKSKSVNGGMTISQVNYQSSNATSYNRNGIAVKANAGTSYSFNKNTALEINLNYIKNRAAQGSANGSVQTQFGFKRNFLKNKMSARVTLIDPFSQRNISSTTQGPNFYQESFSVQRTRNFMAGLSYRFTKIQKL